MALFCSIQQVLLIFYLFIFGGG